ncbi:methyl-accepting chemotaxis protein [Mangrovibacter yixingensis]|uniref:methyl-accepting chemotaxis protein n=1 Tax=Mangrovibacter yixingensis TaxID=1529639 RepID=UPI001CFABA33|nr:methyl-accepting chemotaxis protein [Mangrovibacter yixingensis]
MKMTVRARLIGIIGFLCILLVITSVWGIFGLHSAEQRAESTYRTELLPLQYSSRLYRMVQNQSSTLFEALRYWTSASEVETRLAIIQDDSEKIATARKAWAGLDTHKDIAGLRDSFFQDLDNYQQALNEAGSLLKQGNPSAALVVIETRLRVHSRAMAKNIDDLDAQMRTLAENTYQQSHSAYLLTRNSLVVMLIVGLLAGIIAGWLLIRSLHQTLSRARNLAESIANGELNHQVTASTRDELGELMQSLSTMDVRLSDIVQDVSSSADILRDAARQMAQGNDDLSERTHSQASSLEETAASMEQMTATVKHNAENASQADALATTVREQAQRGSDVLNSAVSAMREIEEASNQIADINRVIDELAFQTNLLALNAAVEAARAGEQGRGFAVVATEVRQLAQRSAKAAAEIKTLIDASVSKINTGSDLVSRSGDMLNEINQGVERVVHIVGEIAVASREQSSGIEQVNAAVNLMDTAIQQNASLVQEASHASQTVRQHADLLVEKMAFFHTQNSEKALPGTATHTAIEYKEA